MNENTLFTLCLRLIEEKKNEWGNRQQWTISKYKQLSSEITEQTKISISDSTIKRLFSKDNNYKGKYIPQKETKNALAKYIGFKGWEDFAIQHSVVRDDIQPTIPDGGAADTEVEVVTTPLIDLPKKQKIAKRILTWKILAFVTLFVVVSILALIYLSSEKSITNHKRNIFSGIHLVGYFPHTVHFKLDLIGLDTNNLSLDFGDRTMVKLRQENSISHFYTLPGFYKAKLIQSGQVLGSIPVHILSNGWKNRIQYKNLDINDTLTGVPFYNGVMFKPIDSLVKDGVRPKLHGWVNYTNTFECDEPADDIIVKTRVKNAADQGGVYCFDIALTINGEFTDVRVHFVTKGCFAWSANYFSEISISGKNHDLSNFEFSSLDWHHIKMKVQRKNIILWLDDKEVIQVPYKQSIGKIKGITIGFKGTGSVDYFHMTKNDGRIIYQEDFD